MIEQDLVSLVILFFFVIVGGIIAARFKQPVAIGLLLIGAIIGPHFLNIIENQSIIDMLADFGAILLLFVIGLEFIIPKLVKIGVKALIISTLKIGIVFFLTTETFMLTGMNPIAALIFGLILSFSSTVVIIKILEGKGLYQREEMPLLIGVLLLEDIFSVIFLAILTQTGKGSMFTVLDNIIIGMTVLIVIYAIVMKLSKPVIAWVTKNTSEESIPFIALVICVGFSYLAYYLGITPGIGAFLAGSIIASSTQVKLFEHAMRPYTSSFTSLFFLSIGTLVDFKVLTDNYKLLLVLIIIVIISRFLAVGIISQLFANFSREQMIFSSIAMMSIGEFSLLLAQSAMKLNLGVDFVSISAGLIFITAVIMSFAITYYGKVTSLMNDYAPQEWISKPQTLSIHIKDLFDQLDIENSNTKKFKAHMFNMFAFILFLVFIFVSWTRIWALFKQQGYAWWAIYGLHLAALIIAGIFIERIYVFAKKSNHTLIHVLASTDSSGSTRKSRYILNNLWLTLGLFFIALFSPLLIASLRLPVWANIFPFILIIIAVTKLQRAYKAIHKFNITKNNFPEYKKISEIDLAVYRRKAKEKMQKESEKKQWDLFGRWTAKPKTEEDKTIRKSNSHELYTPTLVHKIPNYNDHRVPEILRRY